MKSMRVFLAAVCAAVFSAAAMAQQPSPGPYYLGQCVKVKPGKAREFTKYAEGPLHKFAQARVSSGALTSWTLTRAVLPQGALNRCDYVVMSVYPGNPPKPLEKDELSELLKKAEVGMTADQYIDNRNEVSELQASGMFRTMATVGSIQKGDFLVINYDKAQDTDKWLQLETKLWKGMAEEFAKQNMARGWFANVRVAPSGIGRPWNAMTVDVYPGWDAFFKFQDDPRFMDTWKKVHPGEDISAAMADYAKTTERVSDDTWEVVDMITAAK
jgi:hypothetical protein